MDGIFPDIFLTLQSILNFTFTIELATDGFGIYVEELNTFTGMVGMIARREMDMSMCGFSITAARSEVMDFSTPIYQVRAKAISRL